MGVKILFSPSESKKDGGIRLASFLFPEASDIRLKIYNEYLNFIKSADDFALAKLFGVKEALALNGYKNASLGCMQAIERYDGVAFEALEFKTLNEYAKNYILQNLIIFSNLFGPIAAKDYIPNYKLKQGENISEQKLDEYYKNAFSLKLDEYLKDDFILDLRAGFYEKFYKPNKAYITIKFLVNGKIISHYTKTYRGLMLREAAIQNICCKNDFMSMKLEKFKVVDIKRIGFKEEITLDFFQTKDPLVNSG